MYKPNLLTLKTQIMKKNYSSLIIIFLAFSVKVFATDYYVSDLIGNDSNNGLTQSTAFKTIQRAADLTNPGDTVYVMDGTYQSAQPEWSVVSITRSGTASNWISYTNLQGHNPLIYFTGSGISISNQASYIKINGFTIRGNADNLNLNDALNQPGGCNDPTGNINPLFNGNGITMWANPNVEQIHHITISNNTIYDCPAGGIYGSRCDYITIENNTIYDNAWYTIYGSSGIAFYQNSNFDLTTGHKMIIRNNKMMSNYNLVPWLVNCGIYDGNGIIIDDSKQTQNGSTLSPYVGRTLIENNIIYGSSGPAIHVYESEHVDIINNSTYYNQQEPVNFNGEIDANNSNDVLIRNNIMYAKNDKPINTIINSTNVTLDHNLLFGGNGSYVLGTNSNIGNPNYINPSMNIDANFNISSNSLAIDNGSSVIAASNDFNGNARPVGDGYDIGAYEYVSSEVPVKLFLKSPYGYTTEAYLTGNFNNFTSGLEDYKLEGPDNRGFFSITKDFQPNTYISYVFDVNSGPLLSDPFNTQNPESDYPSNLEIANPMITYLLPQNSSKYPLTPNDSIWALFAFKEGQPIIESSISLKINNVEIPNASQYYDSSTQEFTYYPGELPQGDYTIELSASSSAGNINKIVNVTRAPQIILENQIDTYFSEEITLYGRVTDSSINDFEIELNNSDISVNVNSGKFKVPVNLKEGVNNIVIAPSTSHSVSKEIKYISLNSVKLNIDAIQNSDLQITLNTSVINIGAETLSYEWSQLYGPEQASFSSSNELSTQINLNPIDGVYHFRITGTGDSGNQFIAGKLIKVEDGVAKVITRFDPSPWMEKMVIYEINPRSFSQEGTISAITSGLGELAELGINTIYLMPIFDSNEYSGYWTTDYYKLRDIFGVKSEMKTFVNEAHANGIKIILDLSISHTSTLNPFFKEVIDIKEDSPFSDFYIWDGEPSTSNYAYSLSYSAPDVNYDSEIAVNYMLWIAEYWLKEFDIDGYRGDVAWGIYHRNPEFWKIFRQHVKNIKPDVFMVSESFPPYNQVFDDGFDAVFDFNLRGFGYEDENIITKIFQNESSLDDLDNVIRSDYPGSGIPVRFADLHDFDRAVKTYGLEKTKLFYSLIFSSRGIPFIWSGSEYGSSFAAYDYTPYERNDQYGLREYLKKMIEIRKKYVNNYSSMKRINNSNSSEVYATVIQTDDHYLIAIHNFSENDISGTFDLSSLELDCSKGLTLNNLLDGSEKPLCQENLQEINYSVSGYNSLLFHINEQESLSINDIKYVNNIILYPNPVTDELNVYNNSDSAIENIEVYNMLGEKILSEINTDNKFDISSLPSGIYLVKVILENEILTTKVIKR